MASAPPEAPVSGHLAKYRPPEQMLRFTELIKHGATNSLLVWPAPTYRELMIPFKAPMGTALFLSDPAGLRQVLGNASGHFGKADLQQRVLMPALGRGILTTEGEEWAWQRRALQPAFQARHLAQMVPAMGRVTRTHIARLRDEAVGRAIDVHGPMTDLTLDILCSTLFSDLEFDRHALGDAITDFLALGPDYVDFLGLPTWFPRAKARPLKALVKRLDGLMAEIVARRRAEAHPPDDFLTRLMNARDETTGRSFCDEDIRANLVTFLAAGHETTAVALTWALYVLSEFPGTASAIRAEAREVLGDGPGEISAAQVQRLAFTRQVFEETMRLYPPVPMFDRKTLVAETVCGHALKRNSVIVVAPYVLHRHEKLWEAPDSFDPARFAPETVKARDPYCYIPFNRGPRSCIGAAFAMTEGVLALAMLAQAFEVTGVTGHEIELVAQISLRPRGGMPLHLTAI